MDPELHLTLLTNAAFAICVVEHNVERFLTTAGEVGQRCRPPACRSVGGGGAAQRAAESSELQAAPPPFLSVLNSDWLLWPKARKVLIS